VRRQVLTGTVTALVIALLGVPLGLLWQAISPAARYAVVAGKPVLADPETQALISTDGRFAVLAVLSGALCGVGAYLLAGRTARGADLILVTGLAAGGIAAALVAWRVGHHVGLDTYQRLVARAADGTMVTGTADLHAVGVVVFWPVAAVGAFGLLEAVDLAGRHRVVPPVLGPDLRDGGGTRPGEPEQIGGGQFDLQAAPAGRDEDRPKS
jgi:hypothetical protein